MLHNRSKARHIVSILILIVGMSFNVLTFLLAKTNLSWPEFFLDHLMHYTAVILWWYGFSRYMYIYWGIKFFDATTKE